ncbi:MAG: MotA/TolQ/ExbB proton channel family protein [Verrucomicrobia bacterium]|nr:MotA/TolQ/ExbB proton channel family protein [Verrucomicrobiota bacterium]
MQGDFLERSWRIWTDGGMVMIPLFFVSLCIYTLAAQLLLYFYRRQSNRVAEDIWQGWIARPGNATGEVGEIIRYTQDEVGSLADIQGRFTEVTSSKIPPVERRLFIMHVLVLAAPLLGLLGTVLGMLTTFRAISVGGGKMAEMVAKGISEALITTEMGLLIAIPGYFLTYVIRRKKAEYEAFLARLESCTIQFFKKNLT